MPVDLYVGGIEHATLHLLYARFWHKVLYDAGLVSTPEPFKKLFNQGKVQARSFRDHSGRYYYPAEVEQRGAEWYATSGAGPLATRVEKMSKSRYNVVNPDDIVEAYGADTLRVYEMFMGPLEDNVIWQSDGLSGAQRFLERSWRLFEGSLKAETAGGDEPLLRHLHRTIKKVTEDLERLRLNTAVSQLMIFLNDAARRNAVSRNILDAFIRLLAPFAPHVCEEMWQRLGHDSLVLEAPWPEYDPALCEEEAATIVVQVNGKLRARLSMPRDASEEEVRHAALATETIRRWIGEKSSSLRFVFVPNKLLNIVL